MKKNKILKGAGVLLIVAAMVLSSIAVTADTNTIKTMKEKDPVLETFDTLLSEGFEDGVMPPPGGWSTIDTNPTRNWGIVDIATYPDFVHSGDYAAWVNYDDVAPSDEWLISPDIDLTGYSEVTLVFWAESNTNWPSATMELHIKGEGFDDVIWDMIQDESWDDFIYREMTFDLSNYVDQTINISWRYVGFDGNSFGLDDILLSSGEPPVPDLCCEGSLSWTDVEPGANVTGEFQVCNCGEEGSFLNWQFQSAPSWPGAIWEIEPDSGTGLAEGDCVTITVNVTAPPDKNSEFTGKIKIINSDDPSDYCEIDVSLTTPRNKAFNFNFNLLEWLFEQFPNAFPALRCILGL